MREYPAWQAFQSLVRESFHNRVTAGMVAFAAKAALAEQVNRAERADATTEKQRDDLGKVDVQLGDARLTIERLKDGMVRIVQCHAYMMTIMAEDVETGEVGPHVVDGNDCSDILTIVCEVFPDFSCWAEGETP